jgi:hypothetical protein
MSYITFDDLRNLINESYDSLRPVLSTALIRAINLAEERHKLVQHSIYSLIMNFLSPMVSDFAAIQTYLDDDRTQDSATRALFVPFTVAPFSVPAAPAPIAPAAPAPIAPAAPAPIAPAAPSIVMPMDIYEAVNPMPEGLEEARAPGIPSEAEQDFPAIYAAARARRVAAAAAAAPQEPEPDRFASLSRFLGRFRPNLM